MATANYTSLAPCYVIDARGSTPTSGGTLSYAAQFSDGVTLDYYQPTPGYFVFVADDVYDTIYNIIITESTDTSNPVTVPVTISAIDPNGKPTTTSSNVSINETVARVNGVWV